MRLWAAGPFARPPLFQSTHPVWDATRYTSPGFAQPAFQSTHPVWDATQGRRTALQGIRISIHASRMGCDYNLMFDMQTLMLISIHASRMGCDSTTCEMTHMPRNFNPRIPYGMRPEQAAQIQQIGDFNPRIPYGMRRDCGLEHLDATISIHASRMGCDYRRGRSRAGR